MILGPPLSLCFWRGRKKRLVRLSHARMSESVKHSIKDCGGSGLDLIIRDCFFRIVSVRGWSGNWRDLVVSGDWRDLVVSGDWRDLGVSGDWRDLGVSLGCQASIVFIYITG